LDEAGKEKTYWKSEGKARELPCRKEIGPIMFGKPLGLNEELQ